MRTRLQQITRLITAAGIVPCLVLVGCTGEDGKDGTNGTNGVDGTACHVTDNSDGTKTISCDDGTTATVADGVACTVTDAAGTTTISCGAGGTATVSDGMSCTVAADGDGNQTITCDDGTTATVSDGTSCSVTNDGAGTTTLTCDDGTTATVTDGTDVDPATVDDIQAQLAELAKVGPESCVVCHGEAGAEHQAVYDDYADAPKLVLTVVGVTSVANATVWNATMTFTITQNGLPYNDANGLPGLAQKRFYTVRYAGNQFVDMQAFSNIVATGVAGEYKASATGMTYAPETSDAIAYGYIANGELETEGATLYADVSNAGVAYGAAANYESAATVSGCEKCHGEPYLKHGYRAAAVAGLPDFAACKTCHYDTRNGGHRDWQILVDDPARYAELHEGATQTAAEIAKYAYKANVMNDTHMSHAMEFPYPQSMANCATCHEGKLDMILTDAQFTATTCKSCHPVTGSVEYETAGRALETLWANANVTAMHSITATCNSCHKVGGAASVFSAYHTGYNAKIYADANGTKYSALFTATVDSATLTDNTLTIKFSVHEDASSTVALNPADVVPTVLVGLYGWDSKDYIVSPHERDENNIRLLEFKIDGTATNPRFTTVSAANGAWEVTADLTMWEDMIADGVVRRAEIAVMPALTVAGTMVALNAPSRTFDLTAGTFDDDYFDDIVDVANCNACHDALSTTFHSGDRGGSIQVCRLCHTTKSGGSHLEMQSRSIDSYTHAIHSFQAFDPGDVDFTDPVEKMRYELHVEHTYPMFTIKNCESCHVAGAFEVPDQSKSLPGLLSKADTLNVDRNIGAIPACVTGPASRACGSCHRAHLINEDAAGALAAFNQHTKMNGYLVPDGAGVLSTVMDTIMSLFE